MLSKFKKIITHKIIVYFLKTFSRITHIFLLFFQSKNKDDNSEHKYYCSCRSFKVQPAARDVSRRKCVHLYACIVAFASDDALSTEFEYYINMINR